MATKPKSSICVECVRCEPKLSDQIAQDERAFVYSIGTCVVCRGIEQGFSEIESGSSIGKEAQSLGIGIVP